MAAVALALAAVPALPDVGGIDETVLVVGEDRAVLPIPRPPVVETVSPLAPDLRLPAFCSPPPAEPVRPPWRVPRPAIILAGLGGAG